METGDARWIADVKLDSDINMSRGGGADPIKIDLVKPPFNSFIAAILCV